MSTHLNSEGHDESQYLPDGVEVVSYYRKQHGQVIHEGLLHKTLEWLPDILFEEKKISKEQLDTAVSFFRILINAKRALGTCDLRGTLFDKYPYGISNDIDPFLHIKRSIGKWDFNALIWIVWDEYNRGNVNLARQKVDHVTRILNHAKIAIDDLTKKRNNTQSTQPVVSLNFAHYT
jgi:hypothetical protein